MDRRRQRGARITLLLGPFQMPLRFMRRPLGLAFAVLVLLNPLQAGPGRLDASKKARVSTAEDQVVLPENRPIEKNEIVQDKRFVGKTVERKDAIVGERRSTIRVEETREKKLFVTPEKKQFEVQERKMSAWDGKQSRFSTSEDAYRSRMAVRFQDKIGEAAPLVDNVKPVVSQRTTFDKVNRFVFRKNGDQRIGVTTAGSDKPGVELPGGASMGPPTITTHTGSP